MAVDRSFRSLMALSGASTSRVLNLLAISQAHGEDAGFQKNPLFTSQYLNNAIIIKHRLRSDEVDLFSTPRAIGTKVIIPFERADLRSGGKSLMVGQRGYENMLREVCHYCENQDVTRDTKVLELLDHVPSLDPFLVREHLRNNEINPDTHYFEISDSDQQRMFQYTAGEIGRLIEMANSAGTGQKSATARLVEALLSSEVTDKLEPLRATLGLSPTDFREGVFSWRGFIYYKWSLTDFWPDLITTLRHVKTIQPAGAIDHEQKAYLAAARQVIIRGAKRNSDDIHRILAVYSDAYEDLIANRDARRFRDFLLEAPSMFLEIGDKMGAMSHITSFWKYRFGRGAVRVMDAEELVAIFQDFSKSVSSDVTASLAA